MAEVVERSGPSPPWGRITTGASRRRVLAVVLALTAALSVLDHLTGVEFGFAIFYLLPISAAAWFLGRRVGLALSGVCAVLWFANDSLLGGNAYSQALVPYWNAAMRLGVFAIVTLTISRLGVALEEQRAAFGQLERSYDALEDLRRQQLVLKDQLLSNVSHELRTPLTAVHQYLTLVLDGIAGEVGPRQREFLEIALKNTDQLARMIQDLLDASRLEAGKLTIEPRTTRLADVVSEVIATLGSRAAEAGIVLVEDPSDDDRPVHADPARLRQVLLNLVDNALKFTHSGGRVSVAAGTDPEAADRIRVSVSDTGVGISPDAQARIFERLSQVSPESIERSRQGLGLGLYISRELVQRQGGRIWVESEPGRGSTFCFTLPVAAAAPARAAAADGGPGG